MVTEDWLMLEQGRQLGVMNMLCENYSAKGA